MPFLRFSRDKRGYEHTYLVQSTNRRGKPIRPRILYWYRTPPGIRLGRMPFDEEMRKAIEAQNPGVEFDWETLANTPFPPHEPEYWRERRRAEKEAKRARKEEETLDADENEAEPEHAEREQREAGRPEQTDIVSEQPDAPFEVREEPSISASDAAEGEADEDDDEEAEEIAASDATGVPAATPDGAPRKRRRRGGRRRRARLARLAAAEAGAGIDAVAAVPAPSTAPDSSSEDQE